MSEIAKALTEVQANLPPITKGETATVETKSGGSYTYTYADLADITAVVLPLLTKHDLAFTALPTAREDGTFVLAYQLLHSSGETLTGSYPLPLQGGMQAQGSAITYARRYCLCAVVGVALEDDDGRAAQQASERPDPEPVDLGELEGAITVAQDVGLEKDWEALREWASQSPEHCSKAVAKVEQALADAEGGTA